MTNRRILSIDPGGTTGLAMHVEDQDTVEEYTTCTTDTDLLLWQWVTAFPWTAVVCEKFSAQSISKYGLLTVRLIGGIMALCADRGIPLTMHLPAQRYAYQKQAELMLHNRRHVIHETEALAHLLSYEASEKRCVEQASP